MAESVLRGRSHKYLKAAIQGKIPKTNGPEVDVKKKDLWDGDSYKDHSSAQEKGAWQLLKEVTFEGSEKILDIGCGDGKVTAKLASLLPDSKVVGIDASPNMIALCKSLYGGIDNLSFSVGDATNFSFVGAFDVVVSFSTFHWIERKEEAFKNIFDALTPGGHLVLLTAAGNNSHLAKIAEADRWVRKMGERKITFYSVGKEEMSVLLLNAGFTVDVIEEESASEFFEDDGALFHWLMTWVPYSTGFGPEDSAAYAREIVDSFLAEKETEGGPLELKALNLKCVATKAGTF
jgi:trans-aconitate 2-methyltransferase